MPLTWDQISSITEKKFIKKMVDNIFDSNATLKWMMKKCKDIEDGGTSIIQPLLYATNAAEGWYSGAETLNITDNEQFTGAEYNWKQHHVPIVVTRRDELKNSGDSAKLKFVANKVQAAEKTARDAFGTAIYNSGIDADAIAGLRQICAVANTVGGISQTDYAWWQAQVDSTTTTLTITALQTLFNLCSIDNDTPDLIPCTRANYNRYYNLLQPQQRFTDSEMAKGGFSSLMFNGVPVITDAKVPTNGIFMLNSKYLRLVFHKEENFRFEPFAKPINQNIKVAHVYTMSGFVSANNRMLGYMSAVTA